MSAAVFAQDYVHEKIAFRNEDRQEEEVGDDRDQRWATLLGSRDTMETHFVHAAQFKDSIL